MLNLLWTYFILLHCTILHVYCTKLHFYKISFGQSYYIALHLLTIAVPAGIRICIFCIIKLLPKSSQSNFPSLGYYLVVHVMQLSCSYQAVVRQAGIRKNIKLLLGIESSVCNLSHFLTYRIVASSNVRY